MTEIQIDTRVFNPVYRPFLDCMSRTQIFYGGSASGKSVFVAQRVIYDILRGGRNYLIARAVARTVRRSVFNELQKVIVQWGLLSLFDTNKSEGIITCSNGYQILFAGLDDVEKIKSITPAKGVITDIWVEEATETSSDNIKQLYKRQRGGSDDIPKRMVLTFNPIMQSHSLYQAYFSPLAWADDQTQHTSDELTILKTTHRDNQFLTESDRSDLENETDKYFYDVYTLGNWGVLGDVIFTNWETADLSDMTDQFTNSVYGLDFGFSSDPAALVCTHYDDKRGAIYVYNEVYERGLTNDILAGEIKPLINNGYVICDSAEPKSIAELNQMGINAAAARKGRDSVNHGIDWLQRQKIIIDKRCVNMRNELQQYQWRKDKDGNSLRQPVDKNNHLIDALRYAYEDKALSVEVVENPFYN
jgi:phage terminase large subunit